MDTDAPAPSVGRRADSRRNRERLFAAAKALFSSQGTAAPFDEIARKAGVGNATLYRHFPTRGDLLVAVYSEEVAALRDTGADEAGRTPTDALFHWLRRFIDHVIENRPLADALAAIDAAASSSPFERWHRSMLAAASRLLEAAQSTGKIRPDVDALDLLSLATAVARSSNGLDQAERLLAVLQDGLARTATAPAPRVRPRRQGGA